MDAHALRAAILGSHLRRREISIIQLGPKEARVEIVKTKLLRSPYFRNALRGLFLATLGTFCTKAYMTERSRLQGDDSVNFRAQWV